MQDREVVAAVVAGDPDGAAEAYDRYAAPLFAYCLFMLLEPEDAAETVLDTFLVATARLEGLRDPDRLGPWLHAVARNECLRRLGVADSADPAGALPEITPPPELRGQVLTACADNSPAGRAHRMSVAHRAGEFGLAGFPKAIGFYGPRWWRRAQRHPRVTAAVALVAALAASAGVTMILTAGGAHQPQASRLPLRVATSGPASSAAQGGAGRRPGPSSSPARTASSSPSPSPGAPTPTTPGRPPSPGPTGRGTPPAPPSSPSPSASPTQGYLLLAPDKLMLMSKNNEPASGFFVLTDQNGPISNYTIKVPAAAAGEIMVSPSAGSLATNAYVTVTVTVTSRAALTTHLTVEPGNLTVTVVFKTKTKTKGPSAPEELVQLGPGR